MSVVFTDNGGVEWQDIDQQQGFWSSLRKLSSPSRVRTETWERTRLHVRRALEILKGFRAETLDYIASILQDISGWNTAVTTKVNELALNLVELYVTLLISMAPEVKNLPPEVFEQLAGILTRVRDLVEHRSRLSLTQRYIRRKQFRKEITFHRRALINVLAPCSKSTAVRRNFIIESQIRLDEAHSTLHGSMHDHPGRALTDSPDGEDARSVSSTLEADDGISIVRRTKRGSVARSSDGESVKYPARIFHPMTLTQNIGSPATTATLVSTLSSESIETPEHVEGPRLADVLEVPSEDAVVETPQVPTGPNIASEEAPALEPTPSPLSTKSHFPILYLPTPSDAGPSNASAFRCEDATALEDDLPEGGVTVSVHSPDGAVAWVELHYDDPLLETLRARGFSGPIAVQLSPAESALAVFGSIADELIPQLARELAQASGFAVMVRSRKDNPVAGFTQPEIETPPAKGPVTVSVAPVARLRGGAGEPDDDEEERYMTPQWEGKYHNTTVDLKLKMNEATAYDVKVCAYTKFKTQPADHANSSKVGPRPEVLSSVSLEVKLRRGETMLDRSFSNIGFLVHRPQSIVKCDFLDFGYSPPDVKLKRTNQTSTAVSGGGGVSLTGVVPTFSGNASYTRTGGDTLESADEKPMPRCEMRYDLGKGWERVDADDLGKDFESYDITWRPASDRDNVAHEMYVEFGLGMHLRQDELAEGLPPISFVLRNQIMVWVSDPALHSKGRGILLLTSTYIPDALTKKCLSIYETTAANLSAHWAQDPPVASRAMRPETAAMSVSVAALDKSNSKKRRPSSVIGKFFDKISFKMGPAEGQDVPPPLPMYETVSRGWDATNMRWKSVIWPTLDHEFHGVPNTSERAAWKLRWHTDHETSAPNTPVTDLAPGAPIGTIPAVIISQAMPIPRSNAPAGLSSGSSILTDLSENAQSRSSLFDPDGSLDTATVATSFDSSYAVERKKSRNQS